MKFNLDVTIPEVVEQYSHGSETFNEVRFECMRAIDLIVLTQKDYAVCMHEDQAKQLYLHLKQAFGE